jgi:UDP-glucose 4-epimerase
MSRPTVLVTGALGYLGGRLVHALCAAGFPVIGTSRKPRPAPEAWPAGARLATLDPAEGVDALAQALRGVDCVVHLAAANEVDSAADPDRAVIDTGLGARRVLEAAIAAGATRLIFLSTIHVYGAPLTGRLGEDRPPRPSHPYAISHRLGEDFVLAAHDAGRIQGVVVRLSNGIGAPAWPQVDRWTLVGNDLARQVVQTGQIVLKTSGVQWRDFITLADVCAGLQSLIEADASVLGDGLFNLGGGLPLRIIDVAEHMAIAAQLVTGRTPPILRPLPAEDSGSAPFDFPTDKIQAVGFRPSGSAHLQAELQATIRLLL